MKKYIDVKIMLPVFFIGVSFLLALFFRLYYLDSLPVFVDEAIYIRWAQVMRAEPELRFLPLSDGKQPLFMWSVIPFLKVINDPLVAGRLVSAFSGIFILVGIYVLSLLMFKSQKVAILASLIYAVSPFSVFFDRMALVDTMLSLWGVWAAAGAVIFYRTRRLDAAMITGFLLGAALLTKSSAFFFALLLPTTIIFFRPQKHEKLVSFAYVCLLTGFLYLIAFAVFNILRLGPNFHLIFSRNYDYVHPLNHILTSPLSPFISNFKRYLDWLYFFLPYPFLLLIPVALINSKKYLRQTLLVLVWAIFPVLVQSEYSIAFTARYVLFTIPFLVIFISSSILNKRYSKLVLFVVAFGLVLSTYRSFYLIKDPAKLDMPQGERSGYLEDWTAGWGIKDSAEFLKMIVRQNQSEKIVVATEGYFGTLPDGLQIYLNDEKNITVVGVGLGINNVPEQLVQHKKSGGRSFLAANSSRLNFSDDFDKYGLKEILSVKKPKRTPGTHGYVSEGESETYYLLELVDISKSSDIVLPQ